MNKLKRVPRSQEQVQGKPLWQVFAQEQQAAIWNFVANPGIGPIPAAASWIYSGFTQTGTLANSSTAVTGLTIGTGMLAVGQVVTGTGIVNNPPTTITAITPNTAITLSQNTTSTAAGAQTLTFQGVPGLQTAQFSQYPFFAVPSPSATDVPGCAWYIPETQALNAGALFTPANGVGIIALTSGTTPMTLQMNFNGSWTSVFTGTASVTSYTSLMMVDATTARINCPTTAGTFLFYRMRGATYY